MAGKILVSDSSKLIMVGSMAAVSAGLLVGAWWFRKYLKNRIPKKWMKIGEVDQLFIYPVKSFKGNSCPEFDCTPSGPQSGFMRDRSFIVVNRKGRFVTGRDYPRMVQMMAKFSDNTVTFSCLGEEEECTLDLMNIPGYWRKIRMKETLITGIDCGDAVSEWISKYIGSREDGFRIVFCGFKRKGTGVRGNVEMYSKLKDIKLLESDGGIFTDAAAYHLISMISIQELKARLEERFSADVANFRPNIVVNGRLMIPFEEDNWKYVKVGDVIFSCLSPSSRCLFTTVNPETAEVSSEREPLRTLRGYVRNDELRPILRNPIMGVFMGVRTEGRIRVGDPVYIPAL